MRGNVVMAAAGALMAVLVGFALTAAGAAAAPGVVPAHLARVPTLLPPATPAPPEEGPGGQAAQPHTANVLLYPDLYEGDTRNNYNNMSVIWAGPVSPDGEHVQTRLLGRADGIMTYIQVFRPRAEGTVALQINGRTFAATFRSSPGWEWGFRCNGAGECRGWTAFRVIPWAELGGVPQVGDEWPLHQAAFGHTWEGILRWGLPEYGGEPLEPEGDVELLTLPLTADAPVGGHSNCGSDDWPAYFPTWGLRNTDAHAAWVTPTPLGSSGQANIAQNQTDVADWPCYDKYYARFALDRLPADAQVLAATVEVRHFGNAGYGAGYEPDGAQDTVVQVYEVDTWWEETEITWDNAPQPRENTGRITMLPIDVTCPSLTRCSVPYLLDVTEIVRRAQAQGRAWGSLATYTASGDYHSGKYIWTREAADQAPVVRVWYRMRGPAVATAVASRTATVTPGATTPAARVTGTPVTGTPVTGTPVTGTPVTGTPATGTLATGTPATGTPAPDGTGTATAPRPPGQTPSPAPTLSPSLPTLPPTPTAGTVGPLPTAALSPTPAQTTATPGSADQPPPGTPGAPATASPPRATPGTPHPEAQAALYLPEVCRDK